MMIGCKTTHIPFSAHERAVIAKDHACEMAKRARKRLNLALDLGLYAQANKIADEVEHWDNKLAEAMLTIERRFGIYS